MNKKSTIAAAVLFGLLLPVAPALAQMATDEQEFQAMATALASNDAERQAAITTCIEQGIGQSTEGLAEFMGVPVEQATETWCTRMTNGIASGQLTLADLEALNEGTATLGALAVLTTAADGE